MTATQPTPPVRSFPPNHRWRILAVGVAAQASFSAAFSGLPVLGVLMRHSYGLTIEQLGIVLGCMALGVGASEILWGLLTDTLGDRRVLLTGLLAMAAMLAIMAGAASPAMHPGFGLLAASFVLVGAFGASVNASSGRAIMTWFTDDKRGFAMSIRQTAIPVGGAIGAALLPVIAYYWGFALVYAVLALMCLMSAGATWLWLHEYPLTSQPEADHAPTNLPSPLKRWAVWRLALASGLLTVPQIAVLTFAGIYLHDAHHLGMDMLVLLLIIVQLMGGALRILSGRLSDKYRNRRRFIRGFGMLAGLTMIGAALSHSGPSSVVWLLICCSGIFANAWHGVAYTEIAVMAGAHRAGSAIGLEGMAVFSAAFVTPFLMPIILAHTSWPAVWGLIGVVALIAVPLAPGQSANKHKIGNA